MFAESLREHLAAVEKGLAASDPWVGLADYVGTVCDMQVRDRGIADLVTMDISMTPDVEALRSRAFAGLAELIERARDAGELRPDCTAEDVRLILMANGGVIRSAYRARQHASRRVVHLLLAGLRTDAATNGPGPPSARSMLAAMRQQSRELNLHPRQSTERTGQS